MRPQLIRSARLVAPSLSERTLRRRRTSCPAANIARGRALENEARRARKERRRPIRSASALAERTPKPGRSCITRGRRQGSAQARHIAGIRHKATKDNSRAGRPPRSISSASQGQTNGRTHHRIKDTSGVPRADRPLLEKDRNGRGASARATRGRARSTESRTHTSRASLGGARPARQRPRQAARAQHQRNPKGVEIRYTALI